MKSLIKSGRMDQMGMTASIACALHCAALPLVATILPLVGLEFLSNAWFEIFMIALSLLIGISAVLSTYRQHKNLVPSGLLLLGFLIIFIGHFLLHELEAVVIPVGGLTIAFAHFVNWKLLQPCRNPQFKDDHKTH